jgi:hypothetical protein
MLDHHPARELPAHGELAQLARDDPEAYEALRQELIDDLIESAPDDIKPRLRGLQFRIDGARRCSHSAMGATLKVYSLMWESFMRLNEEMSAFRDGAPAPASPPSPSARIIEFRPVKGLPKNERPSA